MDTTKVSTLSIYLSILAHLLTMLCSGPSPDTRKS
jgi:hypothetical protein